MWRSQRQCLASIEPKSRLDLQSTWQFMVADADAPRRSSSRRRSRSDCRRACYKATAGTATAGTAAAVADAARECQSNSGQVCVCRSCAVRLPKSECADHWGFSVAPETCGLSRHCNHGGSAPVRTILIITALCSQVVQLTRLLEVVTQCLSYLQFEARSCDSESVLPRVGQEANHCRVAFPLDRGSSS